MELKMNDDELILNVLTKYPVYYLMFRGGSGGEFLTNLISKYSSKFRSNVSRNIEVTPQNRTLVKLPCFFHLVNYCNLTYTSSITDLIEVLKTKHIFLNHSIQDTVAEAINYLEQDDKPPLFRCNILSNSYFDKNNTYLIWADNEKWYTYIGILLFIKDTSNIEYCYTVEDKIKFFEYDQSRYINDIELTTLLNSALDYVIKNDITTLYPIQLDTVTYMRYDKKITFEEIFSAGPIDLYNKYFYKIMGDFEGYSNYQIPSLKEREVTVINYSKIFEKGYLEEIFNIDHNIEFHTQLIEWHEKNLSIMVERGFDITPYVL